MYYAKFCSVKENKAIWYKTVWTQIKAKRIAEEKRKEAKRIAEEKRKKSLHFAIENHSPKNNMLPIVQALIQVGVDVNAKTKTKTRRYI